METKVCTKCGRELTLSDFYNDRSKKDGKESNCKECRKEHLETNKEKIKGREKEYYEKNKEKIKEREKEYYEKNKEKIKEKRKEYREKNKEKIKECEKEYYEKNKEKIKDYKKEYQKNRRKEDELFAITLRCRARIGCFVRHSVYKKTSKTFEMVGCTPEQLLEHLHKTWHNNYGTEYNGEPVHIDHIIPLSSAETEEDMYKLCHYTNLQYLKPEDNLAKSDSILQTV